MGHSIYKSRWPLRPLTEVAEINPKRPIELRNLDKSTPVSFVPMAAVCEKTGAITEGISRPFGEVRKGFTYFAEGDVIFAKITPCMENGKAAIGLNLVNRLGFGSTEFHVLRPTKATPEWLYFFVRGKSFRDEAERHFHGSAGQQRVPEEFMCQALIPDAPVTEQRRVVGRIKECLSRVEEMQRLCQEAENDAKSLLDALIDAAVANVNGTPARLGDVATIATALVDPREPQFASLLHIGGANIVSGTGEVVDLMTAAEEKLISGKYLFTPEDVIYSKIRPKLRKVVRPDFTGLCSADSYPIRPKSGKLTRDYLFYLMLSRQLTRYAVEGSNRAGIPKVNREHLFAFEFRLPESAEQKRITKKLNFACPTARKLKDALTAAVVEESALRESILREAFAGNL